MNIKQTLETLKTEGFEITTYPRPWRRYEARKKDDNGDGVVLWLRFDKRARKGRPLVSADLSVFPLFDGNRRVLNGAGRI